MNIVDFSKEVYLINICLLTNIQYSNNVTSPKILNKELFPHPFGPQTNTFIPERTCGEKIEYKIYMYKIYHHNKTLTRNSFTVTHKYHYKYKSLKKH